MSRTYKDLKFKYDPLWKERDDRHEYVSYIRVSKWSGDEYACRYLIEKPGVLKKKKRHVERRNWMNTPMWWWREYVQVPERAANRNWAKQVVHNDIEDLEDDIPPNLGRRDKPYYW